MWYWEQGTKKMNAVGRETHVLSSWPQHILLQLIWKDFMQACSWRMKAAKNWTWTRAMPRDEAVNLARHADFRVDAGVTINIFPSLFVTPSTSKCYLDERKKWSQNSDSHAVNEARFTGGPCFWSQGHLSGLIIHKYMYYMGLSKRPAQRFMVLVYTDTFQLPWRES